MSDYWRRCSSCKEPIQFSQKYWRCNVSTCNRKRTPFVFCSVNCWDAHVPVMNHKESWAEENRAPASLKEEEQRTKSAPKFMRKPSPKTSSASSGEILIVASKLKDYIRERSGMNTSSNVLPVLSDFVRKWADEGVRRAKQEERKTVLGRDIR